LQYRAKADKKRYDDEMSHYQPPDKESSRKRNKTGYNMFFSAHVLRLKQTEDGVPSERGSVARIVGLAWKQLSPEEKLYYEHEAEKHNGVNPVRDGHEDDDDDEMKRMPMDHHHYMHPHQEMHMHMPPPGPHHAMHPTYDSRAGHIPYYTPPVYAQSPYGYDYSQHHQRHPGRVTYSQQNPYPRYYGDMAT
jgi:hypothetical protein